MFDRTQLLRLCTFMDIRIYFRTSQVAEIFFFTTAKFLGVIGYEFLGSQCSYGSIEIFLSGSLLGRQYRNLFLFRLKKIVY